MATGHSNLTVLTWQEFGDKFMQFAGEEQDRAIAITKGEILGRMRGLLQAYPNYQDRPAVWERGKPEQGEFCLLTTPQYGIWRYNVDSGNFLERVRALVTQVGIALGCPSATDPEDFALHHLWLDLRETDSDQLWVTSKEGGIIVCVCVAFATFCSRLQRQALQEPKAGSGTELNGPPAGAKQDSATENCREMAPPALTAAAVDADNFPGFGWGQGIPSSDLAQPAQRNRGGRPRVDDKERELVAQKKAAGKTWKEIANEVNSEMNQNKSPDAYRCLLKPSHSGRN